MGDVRQTPPALPFRGGGHIRTNKPPTKDPTNDNVLIDRRKQNQRTKAEVDSALKRRKDMVDQIKKEEREAIEAEERRREKQRHDSASSGGGGGSGQKEKDAIDSTIAIGAGMGRRTHSHSTEASFHYRRASTGARVGPAEAERAQRSEKERSNGQPRRFEQIRQSRVEDTLTDFFGL